MKAPRSCIGKHFMNMVRKHIKVYQMLVIQRQFSRYTTLGNSPAAATLLAPSTERKTVTACIIIFFSDVVYVYTSSVRLRFTGQIGFDED